MRKITKKREDNLEFEINFYEKILEERPNFIEALKMLAQLYTLTGQYNKGLELDKRLAQLLVCDPIIFYNLACSYSLMGDIDKSLQALRDALEKGYRDFSYMDKDPDLANLKKDKRFDELLSKNINGHFPKK